MIIILFILLLIISPFIYLMVCPICKRRPQNMIYLTVFYMFFLLISIFYPEAVYYGIELECGEYYFSRQILLFFIFLLSFEGAVITAYKKKRITEEPYKGIYIKTHKILFFTGIVSLIALLITTVM